MNDQELDRRLTRADPAGAAPTSLDAVIGGLTAKAAARRPRRWRPLMVAGGVFVVAGSLAAAASLDSYLLSVPPFSTLVEGTSRPVGGMPYTPVNGPDAGERCTLYVDLGGLTQAEFDAVSEHWPKVDSAAFAAGVQERLGRGSGSDLDEVQALIDQAVLVLSSDVPGIQWGSAPPGQPFREGEPHLTTISQVCADDLEGLGYTE